MSGVAGRHGAYATVSRQVAAARIARTAVGCRHARNLRLCRRTLRTHRTSSAGGGCGGTGQRKLTRIHFSPFKRAHMMNRMKVVLAVTPWFAASDAFAADPAPNDAQIAAIVVAANQVDIDAGKLAESKASSQDVKAFGKQMVTDHTGVNKSA